MEERIFRKSWANYVGPVVRGAITLVVLAMLLMNQADAQRWVSGFVFSGLRPFAEWIVAGAMLVLIWWFVRSVLKFLWLQTYRIEISARGVSASYGLMPWNKWQRSWEPHQIYNCLYRSSGFFDWALRHGDLILQGAEGATHQFTFTRIAHVRAACDLVNQIRARPMVTPA